MTCAPRRKYLLSRLPVIAITTSVLGVAAVPTTSFAQGLFEMLFGGGYQQQQRQQVVAYAPDPPYGQHYGWGQDGYDRSFSGREQRLRKHARPKMSKTVTEAADEPFGEKPVKKPPPPVGKGPLGPFLNDPTLRAGDVVVTTAGLMVYRGGGGSSHAPRDFASLSKAGAKNGQLAAIERANKRGQSPLMVAVQTTPPDSPNEPVQTAAAKTARR